MRHWSSYKILVLVLSIVLIHTSHGTVAAYELFAVGDEGLSYHYDGNGWHSISDDNSVNYQGFWVFSATDIYAVSTYKVHHYDGESWDVIYEVPGEAVLWEIWAASPSQIFVAGRYGVAYYYDGDTWEDVSIGLGNDFGESIHSIWGSSINDVYAACEEGGYHYVDGHGWNQIGWPAGYDERKWNVVWGSGEDDVFFVSDADPRYHFDETIVLHFDGSGWSPMEMPRQGHRTCPRRGRDGIVGTDTRQRVVFDWTPSLAPPHRRGSCGTPPASAPHPSPVQTGGLPHGSTPALSFEWDGTRERMCF